MQSVEAFDREVTKRFHGSTHEGHQKLVSLDEAGRESAIEMIQEAKGQWTAE